MEQSSKSLWMSSTLERRLSKKKNPRKPNCSRRSREWKKNYSVALKL
jgi:hypothetical protein